MTTYVRDGGTWKTATEIYVRNAGNWRQTKEVYVRTAGVWQRVHLRILDLTIASNTANYNVYTASKSAGWNGTDILTANVIVNAGVVVAGTPAGSALETGPNAIWPAASDIQIHNFGTIVGIGGDGGAGGLAFGAQSGPTRQPGFPGLAGSTAIIAQKTTTIHNYGTIAGGGGGGGGGGGYSTTSPSIARGGGGGGGGRSSYFSSLGGAGGPGFTNTPGPGLPGAPGANGTINAAGTGGLGGFSNDGGTGGDWGTTGNSGSPGLGVPGGAGGASGKYIDGIVNVTLARSGTLLGTTA